MALALSMVSFKRQASLDWPGLICGIDQKADQLGWGWPNQ